MSDPRVFFRSPKPEHVYVIQANEIISDVMDGFTEELPSCMAFFSGCFLCGTMIVSVFEHEAKDLWDWPENCPPTEMPVLMLMCPDCLAKINRENRDLTENN